MTFPEYVAVMRGVAYVEGEKAAGAKKRATAKSNSLDDNEVDALKNMLAKDKNKNDVPG